MLFYFISPIPLAIARKCGTGDYLSQESSALLYEVCYFLSACIVVSGFGLPFVLARRQIVSNVLFCIEANNNNYLKLFHWSDPGCLRCTDRRSQLICVWNCLFFFCFLWSRWWMGLELVLIINQRLSTSSSHKYHNIINVMFLSQFFMHNVWLLRVMIIVIIVALTV